EAGGFAQACAFDQLPQRDNLFREIEGLQEAAGSNHGFDDFRLFRHTIEDRGSRIEDRGSRIEDRGSRIDHLASILDPRSSISDPRSGKVWPAAASFLPKSSASLHASVTRIPTVA